MNARHAIVLSLLLAGALSTPGQAEDKPNCAVAPALQPGDLKVWPLRARLADDSAGETRASLMNSFGEFQDFAPIYLHTGIDIRGEWKANAQEGDLVFSAAAGDVWAVPAFSGDSCVIANLCRIYIKSLDRRHIYYYSHLNVRDGMAPDSSIRALLEEADTFDPKAPLEPGTNAVGENKLLAGLGPFDDGSHSHLHFGIFDACENYDGLNPLRLLPAPKFEGKPFFDTTKPTVGPIRFVQANGSTEIVAGGCDAPLKGTVDLVVEAKDVYHDLTMGNPPFKSTRSIGVYSATYRIVRTPVGSPVRNGTWYEFDRAPFRCRGAARGKNCNDPNPANKALLTQDDFIDKLAHLPPPGDGGADLGVAYSQTLFDNVGASFNSTSDYTGTERYFHLLTNEWGLPDAPGSWDTTTMPDGLYQVSAEFADAAGNKEASHAFVLLDNKPGAPDPTGRLVVRDNPDDVGAIPSTLGGKKFWLSPDLKVLPAGSPIPDKADPIWNSTQSVTVQLGQLFDVYLRVSNRGCQALHDIQGKVAWADPAMIQTSWKEIGMELAGGDLAAGESVVLGPFQWKPTESGHRCLLSISRSTEDPPSVPDFVDLVQGWGGTVANDAAISQLNLQVGKAGKKSFQLNTPTKTKQAPNLHFDCNGFPLQDEGAVAELRVPFDPVLAASWNKVAGVLVAKKGEDLAVRFQTCHVELPLTVLAGGKSVAAAMLLVLPQGPPATFRVDLSEVLGQAVLGGMSFEVSRP